jgi:hypothetical protein
MYSLNDAGDYQQERLLREDAKVNGPIWRFVNYLSSPGWRNGPNGASFMIFFLVMMTGISVMIGAMQFQGNTKDSYNPNVHMVPGYESYQAFLANLPQAVTGDVGMSIALLRVIILLVLVSG